MRCTQSLTPCSSTQRPDLLKDPWAGLDDYIQVILDRSDTNCERIPGEACASTTLRFRKSQRLAVA